MRNAEGQTGDQNDPLELRIHHSQPAATGTSRNEGEESQDVAGMVGSSDKCDKV